MRCHPQKLLGLRCTKAMVHRRDLPSHHLRGPIVLALLNQLNQKNPSDKRKRVHPNCSKSRRRLLTLTIPGENLTRFGASVLVTSGETSKGSSSVGGGGGGGGGAGGSGFLRLAFWEAWVWRSKKWRMPNLAGCDGCDGCGFFEEAAAAVRFFGGIGD